ncbi:MAG: efflux RND transporter periplasmic adaptor subunit [Verrucomicrobia bacterium]|nr:efflux RND transporter periplasmic adaptor subunit [Verrucomicrobiota bacterium]MBV8377128.1 efflux RND transporter periplasmic adaptor subunit [Verrucomicrobiota bacterium]
MTQERHRGTAIGRFVILFATIMALVSCHNQAPAPESQPPPVTIAEPVQKNIVEWDYFTGRTEAVENVNMTPRVSGYIDKITFKAGDSVKKGDLLFVIDPRPYQATLDQAKAQFSEAQANQQLQDANFARQDKLRQTGVIAKEDYDTALSNKNQAVARVLAGQASVEAAQLNLTFTQVTSPIRGLISRELVTVGNLVQADTTLLTNIVSVDPIYAYFNVDERSVLNYQKQVREGKMTNARSESVPVYLQLENENGYPHQGTIDFINNQFDSSTGTLQVRGLFPNADRVLIPGSFVSIRVAGTPLYPALLVSDRAVGTDQGQKFVLVVERDNVVAVKPVELGPEAEGLRVVRSGLTGDEEVVINGIVNARPGSKVSPQKGDMNKFTTNQLQLRTSTKTEPVDNGKEKAGENQSPQAQGRSPAQAGRSNQLKSGGSR